MNNICYIILSLIFLSGCDNSPWNSPYKADDNHIKTLYTSFSERPKHLDPARSYSSNEWQITNQTYEPPLQYHYLKRPYELEPLLLKSMPKEIYYDQNYKEIKNINDKTIAFTTYHLRLKNDIKYQPHPAFAKDNSGKYIYHKKNIKYSEIKDFTQKGTRKVTAYDIEYQIKRISDPQINSPIYGLLVKYLPGLKDLRDKLSIKYGVIKDSYPQGYQIPLSDQTLEDVKVISDTELEITINGYYPQFLYWLATPFFSPMPWEAIEFFNQPGMNEKNISLDWYSIGTGPFMIEENNPERHIIMVKNPNFRFETYPSKGEPGDENEKLLEKANKTLPFLDKIIFSLEKENIPYWNKFLQGYYDSSGISSDNFSYAIDFTPDAGLELTDSLKNKEIQLQKSTSPTSMYWGFNMLDETVGGYSEKQKKLRQAISIAFSVEEFLNIFTNGRGIVAHGPIPPGIFGNILQDRFNPFTHKEESNQIIKKTLDEAKKLLSEAGYPNGIDSKTGFPLTLYYDTIASGDPDEKSLLSWIQKQFKKLNINLVIRATDYNRFQSKVKSGKVQIFFWGWNADYPDPENFLFLFYGSNGKVFHNGENNSNYQNKDFDILFKKLNLIHNDKEKLDLIDNMVSILQSDTPWIWGYHPQSFILYHSWNSPMKINPMSRNTIKYRDIDTSLRNKQQITWNKPNHLSLVLIVIAFTFSLLIFYIENKKLNNSLPKKFKTK